MSSGQKAHAEELDEQNRRERLEKFKAVANSEHLTFKLFASIDEIKDELRYLRPAELHLTFPQHSSWQRLMKAVANLP